MESPLTFARSVALAAALLAGAGCATIAPTPGPEPPEPIAGSDPEAAPESDQDRAAAVLSELQAWCTDHGDACGATARPDIYPNAEVPEADRRFVDDRRETLRTLGFTVRWDPGTDRFELVRGTTPTYGSELRDDP